jgi:Co/Zn/Cd efflux system component
VADPICTLLFAVLVLFTTWDMLREIVDVLMEHTPKGVNIRVRSPSSLRPHALATGPSTAAQCSAVASPAP